MTKKPVIRSLIYIGVIVLALGTVLVLPYDKLNYQVLAKSYGKHKCAGDATWDPEEKQCERDEKPDICAPNPIKWNPLLGAFQRRFFSWCEPWTDQDPTKDFPAVWETDYHKMTCDEAACAMGKSPFEVCDFSESFEKGIDPPLEVVTCPGEEVQEPTEE